MTENETKAVKFIQNIKDNAVVTLDHIAKEEPNVSPLLYKDRKEKASTILEMVNVGIHPNLVLILRMCLPICLHRYAITATTKMNT